MSNIKCIKLGERQIKQVMSDLILSFSQKLNLSKSLYFLSINAKAKLDFYFKVVLPSITYTVNLEGIVQNMDWTGLDWTVGLDCTGQLDWTGLD